MTATVLVFSKVIGTVALGFLTGAVGSASYLSLPTISQHLYSSGTKADVCDAQENLDRLLVRFGRIVGPACITACASLCVSFAFATKSARHPYLLYSALSVPVACAVGYFKARPLVRAVLDVDADAESEASTPESTDTAETSQLDNSVYENVSLSPKVKSKEDVSERVEDTLHRRVITQSISHLGTVGVAVSGIFGFGFIISTIGIYGDMY
ncbi:hypothetical protein B0I72DRAFT_135444 [Yarrowia lipolytica]|jgi:autophagy-related protein 33|uniref:YALI0F11363p n=2 Tax=Yarrowia lipolytica TaxID=4952 RepID=Q6C228_YARLI|nr:YALI0F11363p [Yarrowia lipolytica CLIB122]AOW06988.1 hypothetical protein YALI1_F15038g [Yarrowia lipolytica]KAB8282234.1 hypothetical protein BKA91DRAFT_138898 [Yarrowia lipolytica]KAE8172854.1 hypothetical protein BKA90DRAFT_136706 [Yarrowia lipolytica]KAJ8055841.1 hypothetical protein LXG23DRAFT_35478 [Yarrowia lipolytica]QNQ01211.1 Hypothetical protein YALI2_F00756g [Yarrowia lipolytica]|eukprot:XP_505284.1 YALI0F11363p [Yarrowia lipolytica CLIB122]